VYISCYSNSGYITSNLANKGLLGCDERNSDAKEKFRLVPTSVPNVVFISTSDGKYCTSTNSAKEVKCNSNVGQEFTREARDGDTFTFKCKNGNFLATQSASTVTLYCNGGSVFNGSKFRVKSAAPPPPSGK
jgi:hypothetical protein